MINKRSILKMATLVACVAILISVGYIVYNRIGLNDELDFGAGAYYYADIPNFDKLEAQSTYSTSVPMWIHIVLFLAWGFLMYRLWKWVDSRK